MASESSEIIFINRPTSKEHNIPYEAPPPPANPVIRGLPLHYLAQLVAALPFVQNILWSNAGFGTLRNRPELIDVDPRYEPTVIKSAGRRARQDDGSYLSTLAAEAWSSKQPGTKSFYSALDYHAAFQSGQLTPLQVAEALLPLIRRDVEVRTQHATAFLDSKVAAVRAAAAASTLRWKAGKPLSPLDGVPVAVKDEADLSGYGKCSGSRLDFTNKDDVTGYCVQRWLDAGAVCLGKTTMHELGMDTTNLNPIFGTPVNPYSATYYCGGSSGGSAYAVAAGLMPITLGFDGGGSIRIPSGYCGLFGLKTSHGRVSCRPSSHLAKSTAVAGPMAANMVDLELAYRVLAQPDAGDSDSSLFTPPAFVDTKTKRRKVLGVYKTWFDRADGPVKAACQNALDYLTSRLGYEVLDISIPLIHDGQLAHAMTILAEVASAVPSVSQLTAANKVLICCGKITSGIDLLQAAKVRSILMQHLSYLYSRHPGLIIVTPTTPNAGWPIHPGDLKYGCSNANQQIRNMEYAWLANFSGCPALAAPVAYLEPEKGAQGAVPVSLMGMGEWGSEDLLIAFGYDVEKWLHEGLEGGRVRSGNWVDVLELAKKGES